MGVIFFHIGFDAKTHKLLDIKDQMTCSSFPGVITSEYSVSSDTVKILCINHKNNSL